MPANRRVDITLKRVNRNGRVYHVLTVDPMDSALRSLIYNEQLVWKASGASIVLDFVKNGTPFASANYNGLDGQDVPTGVTTGTTQRSYDYTMTLTPSDGGPLITIDPRVDVDDTTPPPIKKSKKKKAASRPRARKVAKKKTAKKKTAKKRK